MCHESKNIWEYFYLKKNKVVYDLKNVIIKVDFFEVGLVKKYQIEPWKFLPQIILFMIFFLIFCSNKNEVLTNC